MNDNSKKLVITVARAMSQLGHIEGKLGFKDIPKLWSLASVGKTLLAVDLKSVVPELKDMKEDQRTDLVMIFVKEFDLPNDAAEAKVEGAILRIRRLSEAAFDLYSFIKDFKK